MSATLPQGALLLFRHGNTFEAGQTPTWVGARTDLPLTTAGEKQAHAAAAYVANCCGTASCLPACATLDAPPPATPCLTANVPVILAGPLRRTRRFAEIIAKAVGKNCALDPRLREIDYGQWEGLDSATIRATYGEKALQAWENEGIRPEGMGWLPDPATLQADLTAFLADMNALLDQHPQAFPIAVTSNGILRSIYALITGQPCGKASKVNTGHLCRLSPDGKGWRIAGWNEAP